MNIYFRLVHPISDISWQSHRDIEIVTFVIDGELDYKNDKGNHETISAGDVYIISAGIGIVSSIKINPGTKPVKLVELWFYPSKYSLKPSWARRHYSVETYKNKLLAIVVPDT